MTILVKYSDGNAIDVEKEAKELARSKGVRVKDIGSVELIHKDWGICLNVYDYSGRFITNEAL
jgi:hypothetical protein